MDTEVGRSADGITGGKVGRDVGDEVAGERLLAAST